VVNGTLAALEASTQYYLFIISNGVTTGGWLDTSAVPTPPAGYVYSRLVSAPVTDGSAHFIKFIQKGDRVTLLATCQVLNNGNATTMTAVDCSAFVSPIAKSIQVGYSFYATVDAFLYGYLSPNNLIAWITLMAVTASAWATGLADFLLTTNQTIYYYCSTANGRMTLNVTGYTLNI
jgi:hypothetical protein